ncbi:M20 family metallo-hydrolase [Mycobacterium sp. 21AC1]|nr:M20 family metallo-hydrolase [Mycobacterium sp. 21AC1]
MSITTTFEPLVDRIESDIIELSNLHEPDQQGWTRQVFSEPYRSSRDLVATKMRQCGLEVHIDTAGNIVGVLRGSSSAAPALVTGSHTDTVTGGGRFDGIVGVIGALELVRQLRENDITLTRDLIVVDFLGEESNDWGLSCLGSRSLAGELTPADLERRDGQGRRLGDRYHDFGLSPSAVMSTQWLRSTPLHAYVELHIEQGPLLERHDTQIGVVTAIAGIERMLATFVGRADHAGTRPMDDRHDAMVAAARAVLSVQRIGCGATKHGVATTTRLANRFASPNVVPGEVQMRSELRSIDADWLSMAKQQIVADVVDEAHREGVDVEFDWVTDNEISRTAPPIQDIVATSAEQSGLTWRAVPSGATHDAVHLARLCPMGMVFVPSRAGRSHCPEEWTEFTDIAAGVQVLSRTIAALDGADSVSST